MRKTYASDDFRLAVADDYIFGIRNIVKGNSAHGTAKANMFLGQVESCDRVSESGLYEFFENQSWLGFLH